MATARKTASKKNIKKETVTPVEEKSIFEKMAEEFPAVETPVETPVGLVTVRDRINFSDMITLINMIVDMCTNEETGEIKWEMFDYVSKMAICVSYCGLRYPRNVEVGYSSVCGKSGLYEIIKEYLDPVQLNNVIDSAMDKLRAREELNNSTALGKLNELMKNVDDLMKMVAEASEEYSAEDAANAMTHLAAMIGGK